MSASSPSSCMRRRSFSRRASKVFLFMLSSFVAPVWRGKRSALRAGGTPERRSRRPRKRSAKPVFLPGKIRLFPLKANASSAKRKKRGRGFACRHVPGGGGGEKTGARTGRTAGEGGSAPGAGSHGCAAIKQQGRSERAGCSFLGEEARGAVNAAAGRL